MNMKPALGLLLALYASAALASEWYEPCRPDVTFELAYSELTSSISVPEDDINLLKYWHGAGSTIRLAGEASQPGLYTVKGSEVAAGRQRLFVYPTPQAATDTSLEVHLLFGTCSTRETLSVAVAADCTHQTSTYIALDGITVDLPGTAWTVSYDPFIVCGEPGAACEDLLCLPESPEADCTDADLQHGCYLIETAICDGHPGPVIRNWSPVRSSFCE